MDKETARLIIGGLNQAAGMLNDLLVDVNGIMGQAEYSVLKRKVARLMNDIDQHILEGIIKQYPDLSPWK